MHAPGSQRTSYPRSSSSCTLPVSLGALGGHGMRAGWAVAGRQEAVLDLRMRHEPSGGGLRTTAQKSCSEHLASLFLVGRGAGTLSRGLACYCGEQSFPCLTHIELGSSVWYCLKPVPQGNRFSGTGGQEGSASLCVCCVRECVWGSMSSPHLPSVLTSRSPCLH